MKRKSTEAFKKFEKLILALCETALGVVLFINPAGFTNAIIIILGILLSGGGIISIIKYFKAAAPEAAKGQYLTQGILLVIAGVFCIVKSNWFIATFPLLTVLYGIIMLITGVSKVQWTVDLVRINAPKWFWAAISAAVTIICSIIILCNPFSSTVVIWNFIAATLIAQAVFDVLTAFFAEKQNENKEPAQN